MVSPVAKHGWKFNKSKVETNKHPDKINMHKVCSECMGHGELLEIYDYGHDAEYVECYACEGHGYV